jgi:hypothetical protein
VKVLEGEHQGAFDRDRFEDFVELAQHPGLIRGAHPALDPKPR